MPTFQTACRRWPLGCELQSPDASLVLRPDTRSISRSGNKRPQHAMLAEGDALFVEEEYAAAVDKYSEVREALRPPPPAFQYPSPVSPTPNPTPHPTTTRISINTARRDARGGRRCGATPATVARCCTAPSRTASWGGSRVSRRPPSRSLARQSLTGGGRAACAGRRRGGRRRGAAARWRQCPGTLSTRVRLALPSAPPRLTHAHTTSRCPTPAQPCGARTGSAASSWATTPLPAPRSPRRRGFNPRGR